MDQEELKVAAFGKALGFCTKLEILDLSGNKHLTDEFFINVFNAEIEVDKTKIKPGLPDIHTVKLNMLENISD